MLSDFDNPDEIKVTNAMTGRATITEKLTRRGTYLLPLVFRRDGVVPQGNVAHHEGDCQVGKLAWGCVFSVFASDQVTNATEVRVGRSPWSASTNSSRLAPDHRSLDLDGPAAPDDRAGAVRPATIPQPGPVP